MQAIPSAVRTLIKSRVMVGANAPTVTVTFPNATDVIAAPTTTPTAYEPTGSAAYGGDPSYVLLNSGKVMGVWCDFPVPCTGSIWWATCADAAAVFANSSLGAKTAFPGTGYLAAPRACVSNINGVLYCVANWWQNNNDKTAKVVMYRSLAGDGSDWALWQTLQSLTWTTSPTAGDAGEAGPITVMESGRWLMSAPYWSISGGVPYVENCVWYSDNDGVTWTPAVTDGPYPQYMTGGSANLAFFDGVYWWLSGQSTTTPGPYLKVYTSPDGITWTEQFDLGPTLGALVNCSYANDGALVTDGEKLYCAFSTQTKSGDTGTAAMYIASSATPTVLSSWAQYGTANIAGPWRPRFCHLGSGYWGLANDGYLAQLPATTVPSPQPSQVSLSRDVSAQAQQLSFAWPNVNPTDSSDVGYYSPDRGKDNPGLKNEWQDVLFPGTEVVVKMGYGTNLVQVFDGEIDDVDPYVDPMSGELTYLIQCTCRDMAWRLIDRSVNDGGSPPNWYLAYTAEAVENIVTDLLERAGFLSGDITVQATGITATKTFQRMSYADAISWCQDVTGFEFVVDEYGKAYFYYPTDRQPEVQALSVVLSGTTPVTITGGSTGGQAPIVSGSVIVTNSAGTTTYALNTDYTIDYGSYGPPYADATITRVATGAITDGETVLVSYVFAAWTFREGEDIFKLSYTISRKDVYGTIRVIGKSTGGTAVAATASYSGELGSSIPSDKALFSLQSNLETTVQCQAAADQLLNDMNVKPRQALFACVPVPWLQVGDSIQVIESSTTISEIYRILSLEIRWDAKSNEFYQQIACYHYGYAPL